MNRLNHNSSYLYTSILYICGFFLFLEWLYPIKDITDTSSLTVFLIYTLFCFFISMMQMKWWLSFLLKGFALLFILNGLFLEPAFMTSLWFDQLFIETSYNIQALFSQQWYNLTPLFRSVLFLLLIWLMSYLLHYWFVVMKRIFLFVLLTFIYLAVLDTFTIYDSAISIMRAFIISFIALGIANFMKELDKETIQFTWIKKTPVWILPLVTIVLFASLVGFAAPKFEPQWPDPVPFITSTAGNAGGSGIGNVRKVGYGEDDSRLGGSFVQDYTPVFEATVAAEHYWRIETKDVYTGKGWEASAKPDYQLQSDGSIALETFTDRVETKRLETMLRFNENTTAIEKLLYPYGIDQVYAAGGTYLLDYITEAIQTQVNNEVTSMESYTLAYEHPSFPINQLKEVNGDDPEEIVEQHTQLPSTLPDRIGELSEELTVAYDNRYDKARAIERYFGQNGYEYETTDVPVPSGDEDYVDQFLFDSKVGYCDNYSTSMVVMLRTLDIPARWVKGFTSGEMIAHDIAGGESETSFDVYEVTNANAHSWVEVYFPEIGWVPFEPTQGFTNLSDFHVEEENSETATSEEQDDILESPQDVEGPEQPEELLEEEEAETVMAGTDTDSFNFKWWYVPAGIALLALLAFVVYKMRLRLQTAALEMKLKNKRDAKTYQEAYHHLIKVLSHYGFKKEPDQTLREFSKRIDARYATNEMGQLTAHFEQILYKNEASDRKTQELTQLWKDLIKRIMG
ncbi:transglutaminaseTgpA domain-containing protein [Virgibacillus sp. C22-A2]|uniref:TransglutaminaseTgpA domain-containing protein n=1 Tax=Virgibacillus tibetensis TaxID=3042313 RepID=A0ABU6KK04_9BACI|nr:transglutaminaseTgpA domain-containing protein [Virgibacillus sp. C22-A2]